MRRVIEALVVTLVVALAGCGGETTNTSPQQRPAPSTADVAQLRTMATEVPIVCSYMGISGDPAQLDRFVDELIAMNRRTDPNAPITIQRDAGSTTLRVMTQSITHDLLATNAFGKSTCAPTLGRRLAQATGVELP